MSIENYEEIKGFIGFTDDTARLLVGLGPVFEKHGAAITERFYATLGSNEKTAALVEGRVDKLKTTHGAWMKSLFAGEYGEAYYESRVRIGNAHVVQNIPPHFVEAVFNAIRTDGVAAIGEEMADSPDRVASERAFITILDIDLLLINLTYAEERISRLTQFTGFSRKLIERCITQGSKKK